MGRATLNKRANVKYLQVRVDGQQRCAAMLVYDRRLAVLPFRLESSLLDDDEPLGVGELQSYVINLADLGIRNVKDYVFLAGYYEPTVLILHEPLQTWVGYVILVSRFVKIPYF